MRQRLLTLDTGLGERHASWLELFFDLVFVLAVSQLAQMLAKNSDPVGFLKFAALFIPVWWSWVGFTFFADRFESEETVYRILMFIGMLTVAAFSLSVDGAFSGTGDAAFVICYALVRLVIVALYARSAYNVPVARVLSVQYLTGFSIAILILLASLLFEPPVRYYIWAAVFALELITPFVNLKATSAIPYDQSHIPERFGLFTIIVLGEAVIATANGASAVQWSIGTVLTASIGFGMAACIWWINFDFVDDNAIRSRNWLPRISYLYGNFFIVGSIVALGIGVEHAINETSDAHLHFPTLALIGGGIAAFLAAITIIKLAAGVRRLFFSRIAAIGVSLSLIYLGGFLPPLAVVGAYFFVLVAGVWFEDSEAAAASATKTSALIPCEHSELATVFEPNTKDGCEECVKNHYKWVHLRLCLECGHVGCCDSSRYKHATAHYHETEHAIIASMEEDENWAWCYTDGRFVPLAKPVGILPSKN